MAKTDTNVRSLENALRILDCFTREKPNLSLVEIADRVDLYPSTASRLISTMEAMGYMKRNADSLQYSLGYKLATLGAVCLSTEDIRSISHPFLVSLRNRYNESVGVYVLNKTQRICIDCVPSTQPLHRVIEVGTQMSMTRGASSKVLLAYLPEKESAAILADDPFITTEQLEEVRQKGYAISFNEREQSLCSIAAPIFDSHQKIKAALFISGPVFRIPEEKGKEIALRLIDTAKEISIELGYS